eukprot:GHRR01022216.1.p1 GENE.GHRR01022216.1~~GHRR01022216.1.p1  ORF type:complete len:210 (+),score=52.48 GHRR01022216.1:575-1204(+)
MQHTAMQTVNQLITGGRYQGHKKTEKCLPVGAIITAVGELARSSISTGNMRYLLRPPTLHGGPFLITNKTITELHVALAKRAGIYKRLAWCLGGVGAFLLVRKAARHAWIRYKEHQARERVRKALQGAQAAAASGFADTAVGVQGLDLELGGDGSRESGVCVVCLSASSEMVYVRCGHMCCCYRCSQALSAKRCPVCRTEGSVIKVFRT